MQKPLFVLILFCLFFSQSQAQENLSLYGKNKLIIGNDTLPYRLLLPENYDPGRKYPLIIVLHGAGERGNDNEKQLIHGASLFLRADIRKQYPAIVVFPQCRKNDYWSNVHIDSTTVVGKKIFSFQAGGKPTVPMYMLQKLIRHIRHKYPVKAGRIYVGGLSMGGMGTYELVGRNPSLFAAAFPICGGANPSIAGKLKKIQWWIFHGAKDKIVDPLYSIQIADALKKAGASIRLTIYPEADHNSWDAAFAEKELFLWLWSCHK